MVRRQGLLCDAVPLSSALTHFIPGPSVSLLFLRHTKHASPQGHYTCCSPCLEHIALSHMALALSLKLQHHLHPLAPAGLFRAALLPVALTALWRTLQYPSLSRILSVSGS